MSFRAWLGTLAANGRGHDANRQLGIILTFIAGAINAGGFMVIGRYTSHMTGMVSSIATSIVLDEEPLVLEAALFVVSFIAGAACCAIFINLARKYYDYSEYALAILLEAFLLIVFSLCATRLLPLTGGLVNFTIALLCFIMGLQNAIISKMSGGLIRTTHVTGICTDIGIELGRWCYKRGGGYEITFYREKLVFHSRMLGAFLAGGILGAAAFTHIGFVSVIPLSFVLIAIAIAPPEPPTAQEP